MQSDNLSSAETSADDLHAKWHNVVRRRAFLKGLGVAGAMLPAGALLATGVRAADTETGRGGLTKGDAAATGKRGAANQRHVRSGPVS
jgi:hypothetical protein